MMIDNDDDEDAAVVMTFHSSPDITYSAQIERLLVASMHRSLPYLHLIVQRSGNSPHWIFPPNYDYLNVKTRAAMGTGIPLGIPMDRGTMGLWGSYEEF